MKTNGPDWIILCPYSQERTYYLLIVQMVHYFIFQDPGAIILQKREVDMQNCRYIKTDSSKGF